MLIFFFDGLLGSEIQKIQCLIHQGLNISSTWVCAHSWVLKSSTRFSLVAGKRAEWYLLQCFKNKCSLKCFARSKLFWDRRTSVFHVCWL